jgi:hypothetical protein
MTGVPPTLYHRYLGTVYRITILPDGVEVKRLATGTSLAAKSISFGRMTGLHLGHSWNSSLAEKLINQYEQQLINDRDKDKPTP